MSIVAFLRNLFGERQTAHLVANTTAESSAVSKPTVSNKPDSGADSAKIKTIEPAILELPILDDTVDKILKFHGSEDVPYEVRLDDFSCTCKDWTERRNGFAFPDIRRGCKHIIALLGPSNFVKRGNPLVSSLLPIPACSFRLVEFEVQGDPLIILQRHDTGWLNVVAAKRSTARETPYGTYSYEPGSRRWSYGDSPRNSKMLKSVIYSWLATQKPNIKR